MKIAPMSHLGPTLLARPSAPQPHETDSYSPAEAEETITYEQAAKRLLFEKKVARDPSKPYLSFKIDRVTTAPWVGPQGQLVVGVSDPGLAYNEGMVECRRPDGRVLWREQTVGKPHGRFLRPG